MTAATKRSVTIVDLPSTPPKSAKKVKGSKESVPSSSEKTSDTLVSETPSDELVPYRFEKCKSGRAKCKTCKIAMMKDEVKFCSLSYSNGYEMAHGKHLHCLTSKIKANVLNKVDSFENVPGYELLNDQDIETLLNL